VPPDLLGGQAAEKGQNLTRVGTFCSFSAENGGFIRIKNKEINSK